MIHQIHLENIQSTTLTIKKTHTNLQPLLNSNASSREHLSRKNLLRTYKTNISIENELSHLINFLDNNKSLQDKEFEEFKSEICITGLKNKSSQITCLLDK